MFKHPTPLFIIIFLYVNVSHAQDNFCKTWYTSEKESKVQIYLAADGKYCGKITWLKDGYVNGVALVDSKNPDVTKRNKPWLGLEIITGLTKNSESEIVGGKIYDPSHGNFYNCKMTLKNANVLELRGYILGMPFLGKTTTWYLSPEDNKPPVRNLPPIPESGSKADKNP